MFIFCIEKKWLDSDWFNIVALITCVTSKKCNSFEITILFKILQTSGGGWHLFRYSSLKWSVLWVLWCLWKIPMFAYWWSFIRFFVKWQNWQIWEMWFWLIWNLTIYDENTFHSSAVCGCFLPRIILVFRG